MASSSLGTALITGASTGIGAIYADRLARRGYDLILVARNRQQLDEIAKNLQSETGRSASVESADLTVAHDLDRIEKILARDTSITLFVNNAGSTMKGGILENDAAAFSSLIALNVTATTVLASAAAKAFKARGKGSIINVASMLVFAPELFNGIEGTYSATKTFLFHLSQSMSAQLAGTGVKVQAVLPGAVRTPFWTKAAMPVDALPPEMVMDAGDLVDAALVGFDRGESVTLPPLADEGLWEKLEESRTALLPVLSTSRPAARYGRA